MSFEASIANILKIRFQYTEDFFSVNEKGKNDWGMFFEFFKNSELNITFPNTYRYCISNFFSSGNFKLFGRTRIFFVKAIKELLTIKSVREQTQFHGFT